MGAVTAPSFEYWSRHNADTQSTTPFILTKAGREPDISKLNPETDAAKEDFRGIRRLGYTHLGPRGQAQLEWVQKLTEFLQGKKTPWKDGKLSQHLGIDIIA